MISHIRNFSIIAHIDAGKSTLADRLLELTHTVATRDMQEQLLDSNPIERERGITIKMAPVTMKYQDYTLNLIDTPGHVDFNYEVERALQACEGAILLVDATKGVQAQTVANYHLAKKLNLTIIPAINKTDANLADVPASVRQIRKLLDNPNLEPLLISAKTGENVDTLLNQVIKMCPPPKVVDEPLKALIFNSTYHPHLGVIAFVRLVSGEIKTGDKLKFVSNNQLFSASEIGIFSPNRSPQSTLSAGSVGYIVTNLKDIRTVSVGDTVTHQNNHSIVQLTGFRTIKPNVYLDFFPADNTRYQDLVDALEKLKLNDAALQTQGIHSPILGQGVKVGFLGLLHSEVVGERLQREFDLPVIAVSPSVVYQIDLRDGKTIFISSSADFPDPTQIAKSYEPMAEASIIVTDQYVGPVMQLCENLRGSAIDMTYLDQLVELKYSLPLIEVITSLHDQLKNVSAGFASLDYNISGWQEADLIKLDVLLNHEIFPPLSLICIRPQAQGKAKRLAEKLSELIPRQQFEIPIQIALGGQILARETIKAYRKDVTAKLHGGDMTRNMKLLNKQKKGKARMRLFGKVNLPQSAFLAAVKP